jgi:hypothetical protein
MVEHPKGSLTVEPPKGSLSVEPPKGSLLVERATHPTGPLLISRAPCRVLALGSASPSGTLALPEQSEKIRVRSEKPTHPTIERVRIAFGRSTKGTESLTIHMVRDFSLIHHMGEGALAHSTAKERVLTHGSTNAIDFSLYFPETIYPPTPIPGGAAHLIQRVRVRSVGTNTL